MACGTGKTRTALWIAEALQSSVTLVLFPSLLLLSKTLQVWLQNAAVPFAYLPVCSDDTVTKAVDNVNMSTTDMAFPATTQPEEVAAFFGKPGPNLLTFSGKPQIEESRLLLFTLSNRIMT